MKKELTGIIVLLLIFISCNETKNKKDNISDRSGGEISFNFYMIPDGYEDPTYANNAYQILVQNQIMEGLVKTDYENLEITPGLAESWTINKNKDEYVFKLRKGVKFHSTSYNKEYEEKELKASDVEYCLKRLCAYSDKNLNYDFAIDKIKGGKRFFEESRSKEFLNIDLEGVRVIDDYTLQINLEQANIGFLDILGSYPFSIYPGGFEATDSTVIGTGPFKMNNLSSDKLELIRNENYWKIDSEGKSLPYIEKINIERADGLINMVQNFKSNKTDIIPFSVFWLVDSLLPQLDYNNKGMDLDFEYDFVPGYNSYALFFNFNNKLFDDINVRKAINLSIDRDKMTDSIWLGDGEPAMCGFSPFCKEEENNDHPNFSYNPELARKLLSDAGFPNGIGFPSLRIPCLSYNIGEYITIQNMLKNNLNINLILDTITEDNVITSKGESGDFDLYPMFWYADYADGESFLRFFYSKYIINDSISKVNISRFRDNKFDEYFEAAKFENRKENLSKANERISDLAAIIPLSSQDISSIRKVWVKNFKVNKLDIYDFSEVYISKKKAK